MYSGEDSKQKIRISTGTGSVTVTSDMLKASDIAGTDNIEIVIGSVDKSKLDSALQSKIGSRPVIDVGLRLNGKDAAWNNPEAKVMISISYTPSAAELADPEHIVIWYIDMPAV